jgi:hypothetical protein
MFPYYSESINNLSSDDIWAIRSLYGSKTAAKSGETSSSSKGKPECVKVLIKPEICLKYHNLF